MKVICLPFEDDEEESYFLPDDSNMLTEVAGWGATNERGQENVDLAAVSRAFVVITLLFARSESG